MARHPASPYFMPDLFNAVCHDPATLTLATAASYAAIAGGTAAVAGTIYDATKGTPKAAQAQSATPAPNVDQATVDAQQAAQSQGQQAAKKGALSTLLNTSNASTGSELDAGAPEATLKRFLG